MSELREECYKCLNNQSCPSLADYGSIICMTKRKFKMPSNEDDSVYAIKFAVMQQQIDEKDKEIEKLKKHNKELLRKLRNRIKEVKKLERKDYKSIVTKQGKTLEERAEQLKKKDKIIDLMANSFAEEGFYSEHCQTLIDNEICPNDCDKCVKQYFERKVENGN